MSGCFFLLAALGSGILAALGSDIPAPGGGKCSGALDCSAAHCNDCACNNGQCQCADGWSGEHCEVPFCANRTDGCSGHGDCLQTLHNMTCKCDDGFVGRRCETAICALKCEHGGGPNANCTECIGCLGAWGGKLCDAWDDGVPFTTLMNKLYAVTNASQSMLDAQAQFNPVCRQEHECVGWGVDGTTGKPSFFPIVHLSYNVSRADKKFNNLSEPIEVVSNHVVDPVWASADGVNAFPRIDDFVQHVDTTYTGASPIPKGTNGIYSNKFSAVFQHRFQLSDDRALTVARASRSHISMSLPVDPITHTRQYEFDRHALEFVQSLPPMYSTAEHKQQYRYFIENYGTSFATSATLGGLVEQYSSWKSWIMDERFGGFTPAKLAKNAQIDFSLTTRLPGPSGALDLGYDNDTRTLEPLQCMGGDARTSCSANFEAWAATISASPILLDYELAPITDLVADPDVKANLESAVKAYVAEQRASWVAVDKCPPSCGVPGAGSCNATAGMAACKCAYDGMVGRMCSQCAPMSVRGTFTDPSGKAHSSTITLPCDGQGHVAWSGSSTCKTGLGACSAAEGEVTCTRAKNGNLGVTLHQPTCKFKTTSAGDDDKGYQTLYCSSFDASSSSPQGNVTVACATAEAQANTKKHAMMFECTSDKKNKHICQAHAKCEFA